MYRNILLLVPGNHDADRDLLSKGGRFLQDGLLDERSHDAVADLLRDDDVAVLSAAQEGAGGLPAGGERVVSLSSRWAASALSRVANSPMTTWCPSRAA